MSVNFTPTLNVYTDLTPFRYWCQKVLPLVYDDSLSYYELLCKVVDYLNKTMEDVNLSIDDVSKLHTAYEELQSYVNNYFDNLDVQEEINNKLDELVQNGTIEEIFSDEVESILNVAQDAALEAIDNIPENVTDWLEEHIIQETGYVIDDTLTVQGAAADAKKTGDEISALKSDLNDIIDKEFTLINVANLEGVTKLDSISFGTSRTYPGYIIGADNVGFDTYYFYGNDGEEIYFESIAPSVPAYIAVTYGTNPSKQWVTIGGNQYSMVCTNPTRIRKSDSNLPTEANKLDISNCIVCITVTVGTTCEFYINRRKILNSDIELSNSQIEQVITAIPEEVTKTCKVQYVSPSMSYSSEQLNIYIPQKTGYVLYKLTRTTIANINADVWRIDQIESVSDDFSLRFPITYGGEIEFALRLQGRSDFSGGRAHGDEVVTEVEFWVDGAIVSPESLTTLTDFTVLKCCEVTNIYDPNDSTTIVATHGREYVFDENGFDLSQTIEWLAVVPITQLYMAMYTPRKTYDELVVTDKAIFDTDFAVFTPTNPVVSTNFNGAKSVMLYSNASAHYSGFELKQYPSGYTGGDLLNISDNGGTNYNKIYAPVIDSVSTPIDSVVGDRLKSVAHYFVRVG